MPSSRLLLILPILLLGTIAETACSKAPAAPAASNPAPASAPAPPVAAMSAHPTESPVTAADPQVMPARQELPPGHPPVGAAASAAPLTVTEVIPPAAGGYSVANLWARRAELGGKTVIVRGKVVKFRIGIMGRNWLHLQDGTGKANDGTNDITVTTTADVMAGDIVTATGTLALDKDFGAGYRYAVIVEGATVSK
jgi:hypothetical protein